tara:strand:- start:11245 stop:11724 length:480 start_codon:yes stop_codon:yes gene_type:complete
MSFQKAHNISNELGEVVLVQSIDIDVNNVVYFPLPAILSKSFRILEVGITANGTTAANSTLRVETATNGAQEDIVVNDFAVPVMAGPNLTTGVLGQTISTNVSDVTGTDALSFHSDCLDADGVPRLLAGQAIRLVQAAHAGTGWVNVFIRLAPEVQYKD